MDRRTFQLALNSIDLASALGYIGDEDAVKPLHRTKNDEDSSVREAAKNALCRIEQRNAENCQKTIAHDSL